jgi:hypothetical protein
MEVGPGVVVLMLRPVRCIAGFVGAVLDERSTGLDRYL